MGELTDPITFPAVVNKVSTLADGGLRVTLDLPEDAILAAAELMAVRQAGYPVNVTIAPDMINKQEHSGKSKWAPPKE